MSLHHLGHSRKSFALQAAGIVTMETSLVVLDDNVWDKSFS